MEEEETLAEALSGGIGLTNRYTLPLIRELVDEHILVSEEEIRTAMLYAYRLPESSPGGRRGGGPGGRAEREVRPWPRNRAPMPSAWS